MKIGFRIILTVAMLFEALAAYSYNMRQTLNRDGLSNSAILSIAQDDDGYLWLGTCDGVNIADGRSVNPFSQIFPGQALSGNIIEGVYNGGNGRMWVLSNYGLDLVDTRTGRVTTFPQFGGQEKIAVSKDGLLYVLGEDSSRYRYTGDPESGFEKASKLDVPFKDVLHLDIIDNRMWVFTRNGIRVATLPKSAEGPENIRMDVVDRQPILFANNIGNEIYLIDGDGWICRVRKNGSRVRLLPLIVVIRIQNIICFMGRYGQPLIPLILINAYCDTIIAKNTPPRKICVTEHQESIYTHS